MVPPVPPDLIRIQYTWDTGESEIAVHTLMCKLENNVTAGAGPDWSNALVQQVAEVARDKFKAHWTDVNSLFPTTTKLRVVNAYHLNSENGKTIEKGTAMPLSPTDIAGTATGNMLPKECSICVTLLGYDPVNFDPDAKHKRGRFYLPPMGVGCTTADGRLGQMGSWGPWLGAWLNDLQGAHVGELGEQNIRLGILSKVRNEFTQLEWIRVDDLIDVQRRRQNKLAKNYVSAQLNHS